RDPICARAEACIAFITMNPLQSLVVMRCEANEASADDTTCLTICLWVRSTIQSEMYHTHRDLWKPTLTSLLAERSLTNPDATLRRSAGQQVALGELSTKQGGGPTDVYHAVRRRKICVRMDSYDMDVTKWEGDKETLNATLASKRGTYPMSTFHNADLLNVEAVQHEHKRRILIADDDEPTRQMLAEFLEEEGYEVRLAEDGTQTLELASSFLPDLILL